jgi:prolyl-tRNA editing enzyme YbaK/EbsC (Cys-tRNA(Pro) deacylase)
MTLPRRLEDYLQRQGVRYVEHAGLPGQQGLAKVVALRDGKGDWLLAVFPVPLQLDLDALALASGTTRLRQPSEHIRIGRFGPDGPKPFAELAGVPIYVDQAFREGSHIYFETGNAAGVIGLRLPDYLRVARPSVAPFARPA